MKRRGTFPKTFIDKNNTRNHVKKRQARNEGPERFPSLTGMVRPNVLGEPQLGVGVANKKIKRRWEQQLYHLLFFQKHLQLFLFSPPKPVPTSDKQTQIYPLDTHLHSFDKEVRRDQ